ncbi:MAG: hypothetical protein K2X48_03545 [Chitinophagaceae bacterium]|nr:hypothetical protein [Chitinophagaceae bacterium]
MQAKIKGSSKFELKTADFDELENPISRCITSKCTGEEEDWVLALLNNVIAVQVHRRMKLWCISVRIIHWMIGRQQVVPPVLQPVNNQHHLCLLLQPQTMSLCFRI